ncbi:MAG: hypothetical protein AB1564_08305 [Chloroflexota bacterium]
MKRFVLVVLLTVLSLLATACGGASPQGVRPDSSGTLTIMQQDAEGGGMNFSPDMIVLTAGQHVRLIVENMGQKNHEFMIGRTVIFNDAGEPDGFEEDFFSPIADQINLELGMGASLIMDGQVMEGMDMSGGGMDDMHMGWMVMNNAGSGQSIIEFTVPESAVGEWEMGCFEDNGSHYDDGMHGKVVVVEP